jgi:hypothetical protein
MFFMEMIDICYESFEAFRGEKVRTALNDEAPDAHTNHVR